MKFISVVALLAPAVLAAKQARQAEPTSGWINLVKQECPDMPARCIDIAQKVHKPEFDVFQAGQVAITIPGCVPAFAECGQQLASDAFDVSEFPGAAQGNLVTCLLQIAPDHLKYFLDNDSADIPIPASQNCALRELHRVAHVELGPLA